MGRNSDPITLHKYLYAGSDPVNNIDPSGRNIFSIGGTSAATNIAFTLAAAATATYGIAQTFSGPINLDGSFTNIQTGFLVLAGLSATNSTLYNLVKEKLDERDDSTVDLYRAVEENEFFDIIACDCFRAGPDGGAKRFWVNSLNAANDFGNRLLGDSGSWAVVSGTVSQPFFETLDHTPMDTFIGQAVTVHPPILPALNFEVNRFGGIRFH